MPRKPKRPCSHPGCPNLTDGRFCEEHARQHNQDYEKYERNKSNKRRYGFNTFSIYQVLPQLIELWGLNVKTDVEAKKNFVRQTVK